MKSNYPRLRVIFGFTLCPAFIALFWIGYSLAKDVFLKEYVHEDWLRFLSDYLLLFLGVGVGGMIFFGIPAFLLSLLYVHLRLKKTLWSYCFVFLAGGFGALLWDSLMFFVTEARFGGGIFGLLAFFLGALSSLFVAFFSFPKPASKDSSSS